jgi:uncharacterized protein GlcG (DUF336 family)
MELKQAIQLIEATIDNAKAMQLQPLAVVILDLNGCIRASVSQTGAAPSRMVIANAKAKGALNMRCHSRALAEMAQNRPEFFASLNTLDVSQSYVPAAGALLFSNDSGVLNGCIGVSGDSSENDEMCAKTAISSTGLTVWDKT